GGGHECRGGGPETATGPRPQEGPPGEPLSLSSWHVHPSPLSATCTHSPPPGGQEAAMALQCPAVPLRPPPPGRPAAHALAAGRWRPRSAAARRTASPPRCPTRSCP